MGAPCRCIGAAAALDQHDRHTTGSPCLPADLLSCRSPRSPPPRDAPGLLALSGRLARQAADLEEEGKRCEAQAFKCLKEAQQTEGRLDGWMVGLQ